MQCQPLPIRYDAMYIVTLRKSACTLWPQFTTELRLAATYRISAPTERNQSQYLIVPSQLHVATLLGRTGCHVAPMQTLSWAWSFLNTLEVFQSQNTALPLPSPERTKRPSGENPSWHA
mmetsp:Transcript_14785/g.28996  ORF Transcript_14785/g.28996 Transcript_14785/m.28996 type:complete len:119 (+) Transcript_14785:57-413(+)